MKLIALMACRNEDWIVGASARAALRWNDALLILNHASTDRTGEILAEVAAEHPGRVTIIEEPNPEWREMEQRQRSLEVGRSIGGTHFSYCDSDEILCGHLLEKVRDQIDCLPIAGYMRVPMFNMWRGLGQYRDDSTPFGNAYTMLAFADHPSLMWRPAADGYQFHGREPKGSSVRARIARESGGVMHLQHASWRRLLAKHALYQMQEVVRWPGRKSNEAVRKFYMGTPNEDGLNLSSAPEKWWEPYSDLMQHIHLDAEPWQEAEVRKLWAEHGPQKFEGLELFGLVEAHATATSY